MKVIFYLSFLLFLFSCTDTPPTEEAETDLADEAVGGAAGEGKNLTTEWTDLFNGRDFTGWHRYGTDTVGAAWVVADDGSFYLDAERMKSDKEANLGGDIVTDRAYGNYELELEWKIGDCGNSGIMYNVRESDDYDYPWRTGPEMQILDNSCHPDAEFPNHRAGDLYDIIAVSEETVRPAGEWNQVRLVVTPGNVQHWLNGTKVVEYANTGPEWEDRIAGSKFKDFAAFGRFQDGHISLQDHGDPVYFRKVRIRRAPTK